MKGRPCGQSARDAESARVGYVLKMFPRISETFILNEVLELERQGLPLRIFSLKRPAESVAHAQAKEVRAVSSCLPERALREPLRIVRAQARVCRRYGRAYTRALRHQIRVGRGGDLKLSVRRFWQACCLVTELDGISHLHAHYVTDPAEVTFAAHLITGIPYSISTHAKDLFQDDRLNNPTIQERLRRAQFIVANSQFSAEGLRRSLGDRAQIHTIYNGIDLEVFSPRQIPQGGTLEPLILSAGRLVQKKGFAILIRACRRLKDRGVAFKCEIAGKGLLPTEMPVLVALVKTLGLEAEVRLLGAVAQQEMLAHYQRACVFALPCVVAPDGDRDILPNVLKEAMAMGVPIVTSRLEAIEELVEHGRNGLLTTPGDVEALASSLELLLKDAALCQQLASRSRQRVQERFDMRTNFAELRKLHLRLMGLSVERTTPVVPVGPSGHEAGTAGVVRSVHA